jgi:signal transduction histidine kinase
MSLRRRRPRPSADLRARSLVVLGLACLVVGTYGLAVLGGGLVLGRTGSPSLGLSVLATSAVALGLEPAQRRLEGLVHARGGSALSPYDVLRRFGPTVVDGAEDESVPGRMAYRLAEGVGARWAQVWLAASDRLVLAASWPPDASTDPEPPRSGASDPPDTRRREVPVRYGGRVYGVLRVQHDESGPLPAVEERLLNGLAAQAGLVLRLLSLRAELAARHGELVARADDLHRSRVRLVSTQDAARRRLERDLHDGAQQHLVALAVNLRLAHTVTGRSPARAAQILADQAEAARAATRSLRDLSRGLPPSRLSDEGLAAALRAGLGGLPAVTVLSGEVPRLPDPVETALYFVVMEAVQNAGKHAEAATVTVRLTVADGVAVATVDDDGSGFEPEAARAEARGTGLASMLERLGAVRGRLRVDAAPGRGTRVRAVVPLPEPATRAIG